MLSFLSVVGRKAFHQEIFVQRKNEKLLSLFLFPNETLDLVCFYAFLHFSGVELPFGG